MLENNQCTHSESESYGTSQIHWDDRSAGIGWVQAPCAECGESITWVINA